MEYMYRLFSKLFTLHWRFPFAFFSIQSTLFLAIFHLFSPRRLFLVCVCVLFYFIKLYMRMHTAVMRLNWMCGGRDITERSFRSCFECRRYEIIVSQSHLLHFQIYQTTARAHPWRDNEWFGVAFAYVYVSHYYTSLCLCASLQTIT